MSTIIQSRSDIPHSKRWVVKVGTAVLTEDELTLSRSFIESLAAQISCLKDNGVEVILVSSGSITAGVGKLGMKSRPERLGQLQAAAAVGQAALVGEYELAFARNNISIAQVLLTHADIANRERYLNARNTLRSLLALDVLTIVNENDTVATDEIRFGDNDNLAALVANMVEADLLVLLTDQDGLFDKDPRRFDDAKLISLANANDPGLFAMAGDGGELGSGGMQTKIAAAEQANHSGASTIIARGSAGSVLKKIFAGEEAGSLLIASSRLPSKKQWMAGHMRNQGELVLDQGAVKVLTEQGRSLLAVGVTEVRGEFQRGAMVACLNSSGEVFARGLINYGSGEARKLIGRRTEEYNAILGYEGDHELIHRDNLTLV